MVKYNSHHNTIPVYVHLLPDRKRKRRQMILRSSSKTSSGFLDTQLQNRPPPQIRRNDILMAYEQRVNLNQQSQKLLSSQKNPGEASTVRYKKHIKGTQTTTHPCSSFDLTPTVDKLSQEKNYTGVCKHKALIRDRHVMKGGSQSLVVDPRDTGTGEVCSSPARATKLLKSTTLAKLNMPGR